ncbi:unnamed protein product [Heligmosomoides polygyrus]|uniref:AWS domain-containing protein n=1 Tax=Heligmosomoides polygyrus TaxID=6339 RepID=A0A3P8CGV1_HELPZ|nr:unnamed protein product [Heligmosomoides polygyrus]
MRELREEIRILTLSLQQANSTTLFEKGGIKLKHKEKQGRKGVKWRKNLLEKLKGIMRRLDRMERRIVEGTHISPSEFLPPANDYGPSNATTTTAKPSTNETIDQKLKRIQPAISRSRSGENGTTCSAHKDCRPGHCCHRLLKKGDVTKPVCVLHRLTEKEACVDGCQCSSHLNCFLPDAVESQNATAAFCKKASSSDILAGSYLYKKDSVIVDSGST